MPTPFIPVADTVKVEARYTLFGQKCENVFYVFRGSRVLPEALDEVGAIIVAWFNTSGKVNASTLASLQSVKVTDMSAQDGPTSVYTTGLPIAGTAGGPTAPGNVTLAVKLNTMHRGRGASGRQYLIGLPFGAVADNNVTSAYQAAVKASYEALMALLLLGGFTLQVVSFYHANAARTSGLAMDVTAITVDPNLDSQRRRLNGRGQ
jgi:hypothetical protein